MYTLIKNYQLRQATAIYLMVIYFIITFVVIVLFIFFPSVEDDFEYKKLHRLMLRSFDLIYLGYF